MMEVLSSLEPRYEDADCYLFKELEEVNEVIFFNKGVYEIGYEFNGEEKFKIRYKNSNLIGAYNVTFGKRSQYIYKTKTICNGWFIRRIKWIKIINDHEMVSDEFKDKI